MDDEEAIKYHAKMISKYTKELYNKGEHDADRHELEIVIHNHLIHILNILDIDHDIETPSRWASSKKD
jgi:hypothetical protein